MTAQMNNPGETCSVANIGSGQSFADSLARGLLERYPDPLSLSECAILLPNRRSCRTLRESFLRLSEGKALLPPRLMPIGEVEAEDVALLLAGDAAAEVIDLPPAVGALERQLLLAQAIRAAKMAQSFDQAVGLAEGLGRFLDEVQTAGKDFSGLESLVPQEYAAHWQKTLEFLKIITEHWPKILKTENVVDIAERRNLLLTAQARAWSGNPPAHPVIAAGVTGAVPAVRALLSVVAKLPQGLLVLPGLDRHMDDESWDKIGEDHPQFNLKTLLTHLGVARGAVAEWRLKKPPAVNEQRLRMVSEVMRPAETTEKWRALRRTDLGGPALDGLTRVDCDTLQEEADVIALLLRETLETKGRTAALVTPDRRLARRVCLSLRRWGIMIDDSGGQPLTELEIGSWLMLTAEMAEEELAPVTLLAFLRHPLTRTNMDANDLKAMINLLDKTALRGPRPDKGFAGLREAVAGLSEEQSGDRTKLLDWLGRIEELMRPYVALMATRDEVDFAQLLEKHIRMAEALATTPEMNGAQRLWRGEVAEYAANFLIQLWHSRKSVPALAPADYVSLMNALLKNVTVRPHFSAHPRLAILGQIEARLYSADLMILGGLNEGSWPALPAHDPWMSRPMRKAFGLPSPESLISLTAHDFVQGITAKEVVVTRARKVDGTPTVPARWLLRLEAVLKAAGVALPNDKAAQYRRWLAELDRPATVKPALRPAPQPPVVARPRKLSVTGVETWMRDPYQIYARHVLKLAPLEDLDADPGGAERGTFIHAALEEFIAAFPAELPADAEEQLLAFGHTALRTLRIPETVEAFWWPRFERVAREFVRQEREWRETARPHRTEVSGEWRFAAGTGPFTLTGKADRIDRFLDGDYAIIDYKSGIVPKPGDVAEGLSPQLPLEALMLERGAFPEISGRVAELVYWRVTGSGQRPVEKRPALLKDESPAEVIAAAEQGLKSLVERFDDPATPYLSQPRAEAKARYNDYGHLARVREWSISGDEEEAA
jgi:ATP-dependent helicase/nuclease subunit B